MSTAINYMQTARWTHCLRCHKNVHADDTIQHFHSTCPLKDAPVTTACLCILPDFDFVPEREGLEW